MTVYAYSTAGPFDYDSPDIFVDDTDGVKLRNMIAEDWGLDESFTIEEMMDPDWQQEYEIKIEVVTVTTL
jgi:hypothetical protein